MQTSFFLAKLIGPTLITIGVGMLANPTVYHAVIAEFLHSGALIYLAGVVSLLGGLAITNVHNFWQGGWRVIITVLGWLMMLGGVLRIVLPRATAAIGTTIYDSPGALLVVPIVILALGGFLSFKGYKR